MTPHSRGAIFASGSWPIRCPSEVRGRREYRALDRTRNPRGLKRKTPTSRQAGPKSHGTLCAMALRLTPRSPQSTGLVSLCRLLMISTDLIPASGDQDHAASPYAPDTHRLRTLCVHRSPHHVSWRSRNALRSRRGMGGNVRVFRVFAKKFIFVRMA